MITVPQDATQHRIMAEFLKSRAGVVPSEDLRMMGWVQDNELKVVVGLNGFLGKVCQIHVAMDEDYCYTPKGLLQAVFNDIFGAVYGREMLIGIVNSLNQKALAYDLHLGFKEAYRIPKMHEDGGDLVVLQMTREECRFLNSPELGFV